MYCLTVLEVRSLKWVGRAAFLLKAQWENPFPGLFRLLQAACFPGLVAPVSIFKSSSVASPNLSLSLTSSSITTPPPASFLYGPLWLHWTHPDNPGSSPQLKILHLITSAKSFLPSKVTGPWFPGIRTWTSWEGESITLTTQEERQEIWNQLAPNTVSEKEGRVELHQHTHSLAELQISPLQSPVPGVQIIYLSKGKAFP